MTYKEAKRKIIELSEQIREHNYNYYIKANPAISDYELPNDDNRKVGECLVFKFRTHCVHISTNL